MLRKLGSYPRQNGLAVALRELGRIERTLFILDWLQSVELRRRVHAGLNKGEARNALARAVFFNRLGNPRPQLRAAARRASGQAVDDGLLCTYLSPLGWGAHQPDRRLPLAQQRQDRRGQVQAATAAATGLACFI
jgi:hypothetical protein